MTTTVELRGLSLRDALDLAILIEEEACERYGELTDQLEMHRTLPAAGFFRFMAMIEERHRAELAERRAQLFGDAPRTVTRAQLFDVEAPEYGDVRTTMGLRAALVTALEAERKARDFFARALGHVDDREVRKLFEELREEEVEHEQLVLQMIEKLPAEEPSDPADYEDEPVGQ